MKGESGEIRRKERRNFIKKNRDIEKWGFFEKALLKKNQRIIFFL